MHVVVTTNEHTENEDLGQADMIVTCLGYNDSEEGKLTDAKKDFDFNGVLHIEQLIEYF